MNKTISIKALLSMFLVLSFLLLSGISSMAAVPETTGVEIFSESDIVKADDASTLFTYAVGSGECSYNTTTGRLSLSAIAESNAIVNITGIPEDAMTEYTVEADLYLVADNGAGNAIFGMGVYSPGAWGQGLFLQCNAQGSGAPFVYASLGGGETKYNFDTFTNNKTKIPVKIIVGTEKIQVYACDQFIYEKAKTEITCTGMPFFTIRSGCTIEVDNLSIHSDTAPLPVTSDTTPLPVTSDMAPLPDTSDNTALAFIVIAAMIVLALGVTFVYKQKISGRSF